LKSDRNAEFWGQVNVYEKIIEEALDEYMEKRKNAGLSSAKPTLIFNEYCEKGLMKKN
jgi:hypothetical protein